MAESILRTLGLLHDLTLTVGSIADPVRATAWLAERAASLVEADAAVLYMWDAASGRLRPSHSTGVPIPAPSAAVASGEGLVGQAFAHSKPIVVSPSEPDADRQLIGLGLPNAATAAIAVPVRSADHVYGVLVVYYVHHLGRVPRHRVQAMLVQAMTKPKRHVLAIQLGGTCRSAALTEPCAGP